MDESSPYRTWSTATDQAEGEPARTDVIIVGSGPTGVGTAVMLARHGICLLYTSDAADQRSRAGFGGRRIIIKKT